MGTPCVGELQFWSSMQSQMRELVKQTTRIADALETRNFKEGLPVSPHIAAECCHHGSKEAE